MCNGGVGWGVGPGSEGLDAQSISRLVSTPQPSHADLIADSSRERPLNFSTAITASDTLKVSSPSSSQPLKAFLISSSDAWHLSQQASKTEAKANSSNAS